MEKEFLPLCRLRVGGRGTVVSITDSGRGITGRLRDLGIEVGEEIMCAMVSPLGDPTAYYIKGSLIALRRSDCEGILLLASEDLTGGES